MKAILAETTDKEKDYIVFISWNFSSDEIFNFLQENELRLQKKDAKNFFLERGVCDKKWDVDTELISKNDLMFGEDGVRFNHPHQRHIYEVINPEKIPRIRNIH